MTAPWSREPAYDRVALIEAAAGRRELDLVLRGDRGADRVDNLADVDIDCEKIADRVHVLRAIETMNRVIQFARRAPPSVRRLTVEEMRAAFQNHAIEARGGEPAQISLDIVRDFAGKAVAVRDPAGMGVAVGRQQRNAGHGSPRWYISKRAELSN